MFSGTRFIEKGSDRTKSTRLGGKTVTEKEKELRILFTSLGPRKVFIGMVENEETGKQGKASRMAESNKPGTNLQRNSGTTTFWLSAVSLRSIELTYLKKYLIKKIEEEKIIRG